MKLVALAILLCLCSACVPLPHFETQRPHLTGTLTVNGAPLNGAQVRVSVGHGTDWSCSTAAAVATTDKNGYFELAGDETFRFFRTVIGDPYYTYQLCISDGARMYLGFRASGVGYPPDALALRCTISPESTPVVKDTPLSTSRKFAICTPG